jgi:hypothetical protein
MAEFIDRLWRRPQGMEIVPGRCEVRQFDPLDVHMIMMRQLAGAPKDPGHLQETKAHEERAAGDGQVDQPHRQFHVRRGRVRVRELPDKAGAEGADGAGKECAG